MKKLWALTGQTLFWLSWPLLYFYVRMGTRTRILIICSGDVLVVKGWLGSGKWSLPGGGLHRREDPVQGVIREVREELGLQLNPKDVQSLGLSVIRQYGLASRNHQFVILIDKQPLLHLQKVEISAASWLKITEIKGSTVGNDVREVVGTWQKS